jgi:hypothetical protein
MKRPKDNAIAAQRARSQATSDALARVADDAD